MMNKKIKIIIGSFLIVIGGIVGFYQYMLSKVATENLVPVVVAKSLITSGQTITSNDVTIDYINSNKVMANSFKDTKSVINTISKETIRPHQQPVMEQLATADTYQKEDLQLISISSANDVDTFVANDLKPGDKVDLYFKVKNQQGGVGETDSDLKDLTIVDVKNQEGVSYKNKVADQPFIIKSALVWLNKDQRSKVIKAQETGLIPQFTIHSNRTTTTAEPQKVKSDKLKLGGN